MREILCLISVVLFFGIVYCIAYFGWWVEPVYVVGNKCGGVVSVEIKRAVHRMGPYHKYRLHPDGKLEVWLRGKWRNLDY